MSGVELFSIGTFAVTLGDVFTVIGLVSSIAGGVAQSQQASINADLERQEAELARQRAATEEENFRRNTQRLLGAQRAAFGRAGVTGEGTPLLIATETASEAEFDALTIRFGGEVEASRRLARARALDAGGQAALAGSLFRAGTTLLTASGDRRTRRTTSGGDGVPVNPTASPFVA